MDGISSAVLNKLYALGDPGRYFVLSEEDFLETFPEDCPRDGAELRKTIDKLAAGGYIDVKYSGGNMYCAALLKPFTEEPEPDEEDDGFDDYYGEPEVKKPRRALEFWGAFAGGALGSGLVCAVWLLVNLC